MNRRQALSTLLATGAAGGIGVATAGPAAAAGPPARARLVQAYRRKYTNDPEISSQAILGRFRLGEQNEGIYWGVRLHNKSNRRRRVYYQNSRGTHEKAWYSPTPIEWVEDDLQS